MRMKGGGGVLVVMVMVWGVLSAIPTTTRQPQTYAPMEPLEEEAVVDALGEWLANFDTYTFMVQQDVESNIQEDVVDQANSTFTENNDVEEENELDGGETVTLSEDEGEEEEEMEEDEEQEESTNAPIIVSLGESGLLNPHLDYTVTVESLVAEAGWVLLTLSRFTNKSGCGVGGFSQDGTKYLSQHHVESRLDIEHPLEDFNTTILAFARSENNYSGIMDGSQWDEVSDEFWWARGELVGGGLLALTFTPPECGCLTLSTYYALRVGTLTLVVGPQAYPTKLQRLVCIDPSSSDPEEGQGLIGNTDDDDVGEESSRHPLGRPGRRNGRRKGKKGVAHERRQMRKRRKQLRRQEIRQAGRRVRVRQDGRRRNRPGNNRTRKNGRRGRKGWKKFQKQSMKGKWHHNKKVIVKTTQTDNSTMAVNITSETEGSNSTDAQGEEERLIDILLRVPENNVSVSNESLNQLEEDVREEVEDGDNQLEEGEEAEEEIEGPNDLPETDRRRGKKMNKKQRKKWRRRQKKKAYGPGVKFCCKQGVKHKKYHLILNNSIDEEVPSLCNTSNDIVPTFANHQFGIVKDECAATFLTCCSKFTANLWDGIKAKKTARKTEKHQRQKTRRQNRKQQRKERRKQRQEERRRRLQDLDYETSDGNETNP